MSAAPELRQRALAKVKRALLLYFIAGMVFVVKAGMLTGSFYFSAGAMFLSAIPMALFPEVGPLIFGAVTAVCFFVPGFKYHRQKVQAAQAPH